MAEIETVEEISDEIVAEKKTIKEILTEMKDISEAMMDLAYSALLVNSKGLAEIVVEMEDQMDKLRYEIEIKAMMATRNREDAEDLTGILHVAHAAEDISNAAKDIVDVVLRGEADHPVLRSMIEEADETFVMEKILSSSILADKTMRELKLATNTGMYVAAIRRGKRWIYRPSKDLKLIAGDVLIASGDHTSAKVLEDLATGKRKELE